MDKQTTKLVHEGDYIAVVDVTLVFNEDEWSPFLSLEDANKLDDVRLALREGDVDTAARFGRVYRLVAVGV